MTKLEKSWILYDVANSSFILIITTSIMPIFFKTIVSKGVSSAASTANWGFTNSIASLILVIIAPILGTMADYKNLKKKLFSFFLLLGVLFTLLLTIVNEGNQIFCSFLFILASIGFAGANIYYDSFIVDITEKKKMDWISSNGYAWGYIGSVIPFLAVIIYIFMTKDPQSSQGISINHARFAFIIVACWWTFLSIPLLKNVKQKYYIEKETGIIKNSFVRLFHTFKEIKKFRKVFLFLIAYFFYIDGVYTIIKMALAFGLDIGIQGNMLILVILMIQIVAFPFALLYGKLAKKYSAGKMIFTGIYIYVLLTLTSFFLPLLPDLFSKTICFWIIAFMAATSLGGIQALSRSYFSKLIPEKRSAEFFGFYNMFGKAAAVIGPFLMAFITKITGETRYGILSILLLFIIGGFTLNKVNKSNIRTSI